MKKLFYSSLFFLFFTHHAFSECTIETYGKIVKLNKVLDSTIIKNTNCPKKEKEEFVNFISSTTGELNAKHLNHIFKSENNIEIKFKPNKISVKSIDESLEHLLDLGSDLSIGKTTSLHSSASLNLNEPDTIKANCSNCEQPGQKNIKIKLNGQTIWISAELHAKRVGFIAKKEINPFQKKLSTSQFQEQTFFDDGKKHLFTDLKNIHFYKTNKKLNIGEILKVSDLSRKVLVRPGQRIKVILNGKNISLKSSAVSRSLGKIGDYIEVYNTKTNKKLTAQVIDFNTVMVEL